MMPFAINESTDASTGVTTQTVIPWTPALLRSEIAELRWQHEIGGCQDPFDATLRLLTDRESQSLLTSTVLGAMVDPTRTYAWKFAFGQVRTRNGSQAVQMGKRVMDHVQACRQREADLIARIEGGEDLEAIAADIHSDWPGA